MEKVRYMISDAAAAVDVETHVLRYWEDELGLDVPRNELGHRYYTRDNIKQFLRIRSSRGRAISFGQSAICFIRMHQVSH